MCQAMPRACCGRRRSSPPSPVRTRTPTNSGRSMRLPDPCLVVLVGAPGAGKSHWAAQWFRPEAVVSSDRLRALVGTGEHDQRASKDAFAVLDLVVDRRLKRKLTTVVDSTALEEERRHSYVELARRHRVPVYAVAFDTDASVCRARNRERDHTVPSKVLTGMLEAAERAMALLPSESFDAVLSPEPI